MNPGDQVAGKRPSCRIRAIGLNIRIVKELEKGVFMSKGEFVNNLQEIRKRALSHIQKGFITPDYRSDREVILKILNEALANEIVCVLRYKWHFYEAQDIDAAAAKSFQQRAAEERGHADKISFRIFQLGGEPGFSLAGLAHRNQPRYGGRSALIEMVREDMTAERITIESYSEMIHYLGDGDIPTRRMLENILAVEEKHVADMDGFLKTMNANSVLGPL